MPPPPPPPPFHQWAIALRLTSLLTTGAQIFEYNGSAIVAMAGKECFAIGSDLRFGVQFQTLATDYRKVRCLGCLRLASRMLLLEAGLSVSGANKYASCFARASAQQSTACAVPSQLRALSHALNAL